MTEEWKYFKIENLFDIYTGKDLILYEIEDGGDIPIVTHSKINQGIEYFTKEIIGRQKFNHKRTLSLADRGNFISFVQEEDFYVGTRVKALVLKNKYNTCNKNILLFISTLINNESFRFDYGRNATHRLNELAIKLPVVGSEPDWNFMDKYIAYCIEKSIEKIDSSFLEQRSSSLNIEDFKTLFKNVRLIDFMNLNSTVDQIDKINLDLDDDSDTFYPYITRTGKNNGIDCYIKEQPNRLRNKGNCISIGLDTQTLSYQQNDFYTGQNIQILRHDKLNKYNSLFIISIMKMELYKYGWSRGLTLERLRNFTCNLPLKGDSLDWDFMERYIRSINYSKYV